MRVPDAPPSRPRAALVRNPALVGALLLGVAFFVRYVGRHAPVAGWPFFRYALCWALTGLFSAACVAVGHGVVRALVPGALALREHLVSRWHREKNLSLNTQQLWKLTKLGTRLGLRY